VAQRQRQGFLASVTWVRASACMPVTPAVSYLPTGLAGCSVGLVVVRVSWPGHPGLPKKKQTKEQKQDKN